MDKNPDGPCLIGHVGGSAGLASLVHARAAMLRHQGGSIPDYKRIRGGAWEYLGR